MNKIPKNLREQLASDQFYSRCCITGLSSTFADPIQWHHNMVFAGKQVQARFAILPVLKSVHDQANNKEIREKLDWVMLNRMSTEDLMLYGKGIRWYARLEGLNYKFGVWKPWVEEGNETIAYA